MSNRENRTLRGNNRFMPLPRSGFSRWPPDRIHPALGRSADRPLVFRFVDYGCRWITSSGDDIYRRSHIYAVNVESEEIEQLTRKTGFWTSPAMSTDGRYIAYTGYPASDATYEMERIHLMDANGDNARQLSDTFDRPPGILRWPTNDRGIYFNAQDDGYLNVFYMNLNGDVRAVTTGKHTITLDSLSANGRTGVGIATSYYEPGDVHSYPLNGRGEPTRLTAVNADLLSGKKLGEHEEIWYEAADGNRAHGWIVKPPDFDAAKRYPLLMEIHGGPYSMYTGRFNFQYQVFAANGFVVVYTNPRGSTGYGEAFSQAIDHVTVRRVLRGPEIRRHTDETVAFQ